MCLCADEPVCLCADVPVHLRVVVLQGSPLLYQTLEYARVSTAASVLEDAQTVRRWCGPAARPTPLPSAAHPPASTGAGLDAGWAPTQDTLALL
jgi:hypothetical protein